MRLCLVILIFVAAPISLQAQQARDSLHTSQLYWFGLGLGAVAPGPGLDAEVTFVSNTFNLSAKAQGGASINIFGPNEAYGWCSVSAGIQTYSGDRVIRFAAGPAYFTHERDTSSIFGGFRQRIDNGYGVNVEVEAVLIHSKYFGLSGMLAALFADKNFTWGITINGLIGKLE